jgi:UDP-glucose 4-epimerase
VIVVDNLSNCFESVLHNIKKLIYQHCKEKGTPQPLLHYHRVDYRSRSMRFLLESYADLVPSSSETGSRRRGGTHQSRITGVIHFAAFKSVAESIGKPLQYYKNNVSGLVSLLQLLDQYGIHNFIFSSSATVYGTKANAGIPLREEDLVHHPETYIDADGQSVVAQPNVAGLTCPYARTKYFSEAILADLAAADPSWRIVALRYFNPVGSDPSGLLGESPRNTPTNLYPMITQVLTGVRPALDVFGADWSTRDGTAIRDYIHVLDVARGHIAALRQPAATSKGFRAYNLGSGTGTTVLEAVRSLEAAASQPIPLRWAGRRPGDVGTCVASTERAARELGWFPRESISQCAADLWNFVQRTTGFGGAVTKAEAF